jgi:hypothetical protein
VLRDSDTIAVDGTNTWVMCPDTSIGGAAVLAERLVNLNGWTGRAFVVSFPHGVLDAGQIMSTARTLMTGSAGVDGPVILAPGLDEQLDLTDAQAAVDLTDTAVTRD